MTEPEPVTRVRLEALLETLDGQTLPPDLLSSLRPTQPFLPVRDLLPPLPQLGGSATRPAEVALTGKLGEGGMGVVFLGRQLSLGRDVAVKSVQEDSPAEQQHSDALLQEAWVTGLLEHPNIVPVYTLGQDVQGRPLLVMKRIEGTSWASLLARRALATDGEPPFGAEDTLQHVEILMQVCRAVHFAHSRGIVHCDLKPDNVMIGGFGEVYVLDWGVALSLRDDGSGRFPLARSVTQPRGTPAYMAPELAGAEGDRIGPATDVYLLGAILHEILTGQRPHQGANLLAVLMSAYSTAGLTHLAQVPGELSEICRRAMAPAPEDRFADAEQLRLTLSDALRHRESLAIAREANESALRLQEVLARARQGERVDQQQLHNLFSEARFGFCQARRSWSDNPLALDGLQRTLEGMIDHQLRQGVAEHAAALLQELPHPNQELAGRLGTLRERLARQEAGLVELAQLRGERDLNIGTRSRAWLLFGMLGLILLVNLPLTLLERWGLLSGGPWLDAAGVLLFPLLAGAAIFAGRRRLLRNQASRLIILSIAAALLGRVAVRLAALRLGISPDAATVFELLLYATASAELAAAVDRRIGWAAVAYAAAAALALLLPSAGLLIVSGVNVLVLGLVGLLWRTPKR